jgi:DNA-binding response OmpR family regulator
MRNREERRQLTVLVAEPQALPGMWLEDVLAHAGCVVSGPYGTCEEAARSLAETPPHFAMMSIDLNRGPGFPLACALRRKGIPFALI